MRVERVGLLWQVNGGRIGALSRSVALVITGNRERQPYRRRSKIPGETVVAWELAGTPPR